MTPNTLYDPDPTKSNVGTITIDFPHGGSYDLVATNAIRSGKIAAYLELRDNTLVKAQAQIDQFAASMSSALSDKTTAGVAAPASALPQAGFDLDLAGLQSGNVVHVTYKDNITGITHNLSIVRVDDPSVLPLSNNATLDPNDEVLGINFAGGMASVVSQLNAALGASANLQFSNPSGSTLRVLDDGATEPVRCHRGVGHHDDVVAYQRQRAASAVHRRWRALYRRLDRQRLAADRSWPAASASIPRCSAIPRAPSCTRPIRSPPRAIPRAPISFSTQLMTGSYRYSPQTGIGTTGTPFTGTLLNFARQFDQPCRAKPRAAAKQLADGQEVVLNTLQNKMNATSGVNIDDEMAHLLALQNSYSANARVMATVKDMYDVLIQAM